MTNEMKFLMYLYGCAAQSVSAIPPKYSIDFDKLYFLAEKMSLLSMLAYALKISPEIECPDGIKTKLFTAMLGTSLKNKMRIDAVFSVLDEIERIGIKTVVVKGMDCTRFYSKPECRISADTDIFVSEKDEERLFSYFEQNGYTVRRREKNEHHGECESKETGLIEVHTKIWEDHVYRLMPKEMKETKKCIENSICVTVNGKSFRDLEQTNAMIFMTLHLVKHFIFSCASIKMAYDLALYYINNKDTVNKRDYKRWVSNAGYEKTVSAVFSAMAMYCGFDKEVFEEIAKYDEHLGNVFAENIEQYDSCDLEHRPKPTLMIEYCTNKNNERKMGKAYAFLFNAKNVTRAKLSLLFPEKAHLEITYPYLKKYPYLYLYACTHRFFKRGTRHVFNSDPKNGSVLHYKANLDIQLTDTEKKQIETLKEMDLL